MKILFAGGGTGGHFYPLIAVAEDLNTFEPRPRLFYIGPEPYDEESLRLQNVKYLYCPAGRTRRYFSFSNFVDIFKNLFGIPYAFIRLFMLYPDVVFSKGGYTSVPVMIAAKLLMIPIVIHESDAVPGRASKIGKRLAKYIAIAHDDAAQYFPNTKTALTGIPIRKVILQTHADAKSQLQIPSDKPLIYITGGSSGAERLNRQVIEMLPTLLQSYRVYHQVGEKNLEAVQTQVQQAGINESLLSSYYIQGNISANDVSFILSAADLVISRSGSTTLFEIAIHQKPAILIPIPESISHDQRSNAYSYARSGAAVVVEEGNLSDAVLLQEINAIFADQNKYQAMVAATTTMQYPDAARKISDILLSIGKDHGSY